MVWSKLERPWFDPNVDEVLSKPPSVETMSPEPFEDATAVCTAPAISGWRAARICATREEVDNEEEDEEDDEEEAEEEEEKECQLSHPGS